LNGSSKGVGPASEAGVTPNSISDRTVTARFEASAAFLSVAIDL
jgi:hypothetical protein